MTPIERLQALADLVKEVSPKSAEALEWLEPVREGLEDRLTKTTGRTLASLNDEERNGAAVAIQAVMLLAQDGLPLTGPMVAVFLCDQS